MSHLDHHRQPGRRADARRRGRRRRRGRSPRSGSPPHGRPRPASATTTTRCCGPRREQLAEYFAGDRTDFDLPMAPHGSAFRQQVWAALREIPYGTTTTYGAIARGLGLTGHGARAVGLANGANPLAIVVPCHRVVGSNGNAHRLRRRARPQAPAAGARGRRALWSDRARPGSTQTRASTWPCTIASQPSGCAPQVRQPVGDPLEVGRGRRGRAAGRAWRSPTASRGGPHRRPAARGRRRWRTTRCRATAAMSRSPAARHHAGSTPAGVRLGAERRARRPGRARATRPARAVAATTTSPS